MNSLEQGFGLPAKPLAKLCWSYRVEALSTRALLALKESYRVLMAVAFAAMSGTQMPCQPLARSCLPWFL